MTTAAQLDEQDNLWVELTNTLLNSGETTAQFMNHESGLKAGGKLIIEKRTARWAQLDEQTDPAFARDVLEKVQSYVHANTAMA